MVLPFLNRIEMQAMIALLQLEVTVLILIHHIVVKLLPGYDYHSA